jgi:hypothetical protein
MKIVHTAFLTLLLFGLTFAASYPSCMAAGGTLKCCNFETAQKLVNHGLLPLGSDLQNLLEQCNDITVPVVGIAVPVRSQCAQEILCCGEINQNGRINFGCTPFS